MRQPHCTLEMDGPSINPSVVTANAPKGGARKFHLPRADDAMAGDLLLGLGALAGTLLLKTLWQRWHSRKPRVLGILPARYDSTRFPAKPLAPLLGKAMILRTYDQARRAASLDAVIVATDDERIMDVCRAAGVPAVITSSSCANGTERCAEALQQLGGAGRWDVVVNIQGDEPLVDPAAIDAVVAALIQAPNAVYSTAATRLDPSQAHLQQRVKVVVDSQGYALYFSRAAIPATKKVPQFTLHAYSPHLEGSQGLAAFLPDNDASPAKPPPLLASLLPAPSFTVPPPTPPSHSCSRPNCDVQMRPPRDQRHVYALPPPPHPHLLDETSPYLLHLGLQCYRASFLPRYVAMPPTPLQLAEDLEQLRVLEGGFLMRVVEVAADGAHGVDVPADVASIEALMRKRGMRDESPAGEQQWSQGWGPGHPSGAGAVVWAA